MCVYLHARRRCTRPNQTSSKNKALVFPIFPDKKTPTKGHRNEVSRLKNKTEKEGKRILQDTDEEGMPFDEDGNRLQRDNPRDARLGY
jgi:hypothetical protein